MLIPDKIEKLITFVGDLTQNNITQKTVIEEATIQAFKELAPIINVEVEHYKAKQEHIAVNNIVNLLMYMELMKSVEKATGE